MEFYDILEQLGRGTFGVVYLCRKMHNKEKLVIKQIPIELIGGDQSKAKNEVAILRSLSHPNVIQYFDSYMQHQSFCIVMEYASHGNLQQFIDERRKTLSYLDPQCVMNFICQIILGLHHIHEKGVVHRDLKSENIFITGLRKDVLKIGDFGISKLLANNYLANTIIGTCNYAAPEICDGKPYNNKTDIWALGCVLYELCELDKMFQGPISNIVLSIARGTLKPINIKYGKQMQELLNLLMKPDPAERPDTTALLALADIFPTLYAQILNLGCIF
ncbi:serine/threonine-protein kinase Nek8-like [Euwallacea similis]